MSKDWIQTRSGRKFFPLAPRAEDIELGDIAHALSNICRYTGHVSRFYSVGEHSVRVSKRVLEITGDPDQAMWGLLHDASEAYLADIASPVKHQDAMAGYRSAEKKLEAVICERFSLPLEMPAAVKQADLELLCTEAHTLMTPLHPEWAITVPGGGMLAPLPIARGDFMGWDPTVARVRFLAWHDRLKPICWEKSEIIRAFLLREVTQEMARAA
jgi:hypothetical protein